MRPQIEQCIHKVLNDLNYSFRRFYVDTFYLENISLFENDALIMDMGGLKGVKRGEFNIENYSFKVEYANIAENASPDYLCDIAAIPVSDNRYDGAILAEVLEHVPDPSTVLQEAYRILKPGGSLLITTPFMFHVHADPYDYGRYTDFYYQEVLTNIGFQHIKIIKQGLFFSVLANMLKLWLREMKKDRKLSRLQEKLFGKFVAWFQKKTLEWEKKEYYQNNWLFAGHTTGFGIICRK